MTPASHIFLAELLTFALLGANAAEPVADTKTTEELAKESQNPIANLISVPFQAPMTPRSGSLMFSR